MPRRALLLVALLLGLLGIGGPAAAHDELVQTEPADGAALEVPPAAVWLDFTEEPLADGTQLQVTGPDGVVASVGETVVEGARVSIALAAALPAGSYTVDWRVTAADGHPTSGTFGFTATAGTPTPTPVPAPTSTPTTTADSTTTPAPTSSASRVAPSPGLTLVASGPDDRGLSRTVVWLLVVGAVLLTAVAALVARRRGSASTHG